MKFLLLFVLCLTYAEAIISIVPVEIGKKPGFSGQVEGSLETKRGNTEKDEYSAGFRFVYDNNESYVLWSDFIGVYGEASGVKNTNKTYAHLRYIHSINQKDNAWETYLQSEANEFTNVEHRRVAGAGVRIKLTDSDFGGVFFGTGLLYEYIKYDHVDPLEHNIRVNNYLAYTKNFSESSSFAYVGYYQPNTGYSDDYILSNAIELKLHVYLKLFVKLNLYYDIDSKPAQGVKTTDISQKTTFVYEF